MYVSIEKRNTVRETMIKRRGVMSIEEGTKYQISQGIQSNFNSADTMTVTSNNGITVQFALGNGKGHGSMPIEHLHYLLKKANLTLVPNKRSLLNPETTEEQIG